MKNDICLAVVMDDIASINIKKDSTLAMLLAAQAFGWCVYYIPQRDLFLQDGRCFAKWQLISLDMEQEQWYQTKDFGVSPVDELVDVLLMRKDPPFDMEYIYSTYMLELAEKRGVYVVNKPQSLRDANEKLFTLQFPQCCVPTLVSCDMERIRAFVAEQKDAILKPLDQMGGASIFRMQVSDQNLSVVLENMTQMGRKNIMVQKYIPQITAGDKRILLIDGEPIPYALARIPKSGELRGNLAAGASAEGIELSERDLWICQQVKQTLVDRGLLFVGLDVIGDYLTEINVTSPTGIRELDKMFNLNIAETLIQAIEKRLNEKN